MEKQQPSYEALISHVSRQMANSQLSRHPVRNSPLRNRSPYAMPYRVEKPGFRTASPNSAQLGRRATVVAGRARGLETYPDSVAHGHNASGARSSQAQRPFTWHPTSGENDVFGSHQSMSFQYSTAEQPYLQLEAEHGVAKDLTSPDLYAYHYQSNLVPGMTDLWIPLNAANSELSPWTQSLEQDIDPPWEPVFPDIGVPSTDVIEDTSLLGYGSASLPNSDVSAYDMYLAGPGQPLPNSSLTAELPSVALQSDSSEQEAEVTGDELVGMGLYDEPSRDSSRKAYSLGSFLFTDADEPAGKGLKLEETWAPPADDDQSVTEEDGTESSAGDSSQRHLSFDADRAVQIADPRDYRLNLAGQSFFFDDESAIVTDTDGTGLDKSLASNDTSYGHAGPWFEQQVAFQPYNEPSGYNYWNYMATNFM